MSTQDLPHIPLSASPPADTATDALLEDSRTCAGVCGPWPGFAAAADAMVHDLHGRFGFDLWLVTHVDGDRQLVVACAGPWSALTSPGLVLPWASSFCVRMAEVDGPVAVADVARAPGYAPIAVGAYRRIEAYLGVPLMSAEDQLFGSLCAFDGQRQPEAMPAALGQVIVAGRALSSIAAGERTAADRSSDAARAWALNDLDPLTGLPNHRGWEKACAAEEQRSQRYGLAVSVVAVDLDDLKRINETGGRAAGDASLVRCAEALQLACRPGDTVARTGGDEFAVLAVQCDARSALALTRRVRLELRSAGVQAAVGGATRRPHEPLPETWRRADDKMYRNKRRRVR